MLDAAFLNSPLFTFVILPLFIFIARVCDVTIGTVRIMLISRGGRWIVPLLGFIEMLVWLLAVRQIMQNLTNIYCYLAFAGGFAMGNFVGMYIEEKLAFGLQVIRVITRQDAAELINVLKEKRFGVTVVDAQGTTGKVNIIFMIINRRDWKKVIGLIQKFNPKAFYSIEDVKSVSEGVFPEESHSLRTLSRTRKGK
ncbi:MAG: hypothetical protein A2787_09945 [Omnitrophica WOR_2 bacterium RIFCSPHIGHO2_01_FULL_48_9]|nr:MAG: hypothetical protein A3D10_09600 [Omnitrophica WOR_2 bacterium RIFCSPHIGHO2_02_FULL_48_11]OGX31585.1 MAG: hypothetical protein A2787_09945 [Omnitrophica WOR_2 bacterium RIFCSPHIGHO2_01_FULL_48_9]